MRIRCCYCGANTMSKWRTCWDCGGTLPWQIAIARAAAPTWNGNTINQSVIRFKCAFYVQYICILCCFNVIAAVQFINRWILWVLCSMKLWRRNAFLLYARVTNCFCLVHISFPLSISILLLLNVRVTNVWLNEKANAHRLTIAYRVATMNSISKWKFFKATFYVCSNENEIFQKKRLEDNLRHFKQRKKWSNFIFFVAPNDVSIDKLS